VSRKLPRHGRCSERVPDALVAMPASRLDRITRTDPLNLWVEQPQQRVEVRIERLVGPTYQLHVLLRHRLLRQPRCPESLVVVKNHSALEIWASRVVKIELRS